MHTLMRDGVKEEDFYFYFGEDSLANDAFRCYLFNINTLIDVYKQLEAGEIKEQYFEKIKAMLPEGFMQTRMVSLNYEVLRNMYRQRKSHRLRGWNADFVNWINTLPMNEWITGIFPEPENVVDGQ
jgi:hypothetical protein